MKEINEILSYLKSEYDMSQRFISTKLDICEKHLSDAKNGRQRLSEETMNKLKKLYERYGGQL